MGGITVYAITKSDSKSNIVEMKSPDTTLNNYHGIDVSNHQGLIDWSLVSKDENIKFVYIKATEAEAVGSCSTEESTRPLSYRLNCLE